MRIAVLIVGLLVSGACARTRPVAAVADDWQLAYPPEAADAQYPRGVHLLGSAPLSEWTAHGAYASEEECESERVRLIDDAIDRARVDHGADAKFELPVRRAVNARCVRRDVFPGTAAP
jgi:hypothetical protein